MSDNLTEMLVSGTWGVHLDANLIEGTVTLSLILTLDNPLLPAQEPPAAKKPGPGDARDK